MPSAMPARPAYLSRLFNVFTNDFVFWGLLHTSKAGLLSALGVPAEDQKALSPRDLAETFAFLNTILPMSARQAGQALEQHMSEYDAKQIKNIKADTLVIHAKNDTLVAFDQGKFTAKTIPGAVNRARSWRSFSPTVLIRNAGESHRLLRASSTVTSFS
jgi:hypothetical protein